MAYDHDTAKTEEKQTQLKGILNKLAEQNNILSKHVSRLAEAGNRLEDTGVDSPNQKGEENKKVRVGLLEDISAQIDITCSHNDKLDELIKKFSNLI